jgi:ribosome modulation factor
MPEPPRDHNNPSIPPEVFLALYRVIKEAQRRKEEAAAGYKGARERAKEAGVDMNALKIMEHLAKLDDADAELRMRQALKYSEWIGLPFATQPDMFPTPGGSEMLTDKLVGDHKEWQAEQNGYAAGKDGAPADHNPHAPGSSLAQRWMSGWHDGQEFLVMSTKKDSNQPA